MARNGSGTYAAPSNSWNPAVGATTISSSDFNTLLADLETALSESVARDGQTTTTAVVPFASGIKSDTIVENSSNTGVTIDGVLVKDGGLTLGAAGTVIFEGTTADAFETTLTAGDPAADRVITMPDATDTLVGKATTDTLTNKTLTAPTITSGVLNTAVSGTAVLDEDNMASDSATQVATQQSIKAYVDAQIAAVPTGLPSPDFTSSEQTVTADTVLDVAHSLGAIPTLWTVSMRCKTTDLGYSVGDEVVPWNEQGNDSSSSVSADATNVTIVTSASLILISQSTFNGTAITAGNWRFVVRAWA